MQNIPQCTQKNIHHISMSGICIISLFPFLCRVCVTFKLHGKKIKIRYNIIMQRVEYASYLCFLFCVKFVSPSGSVIPKRPTLGTILLCKEWNIHHISVSFSVQNCHPQAPWHQVQHYYAKSGICSCVQKSLSLSLSLLPSQRMFTFFKFANGKLALSFSLVTCARYSPFS